MAVDGGGNGVDEAREHVWAGGKLRKHLALLFRGEVMRFFIVAVHDVVGFDERGEYGKTVFHIERGVESVGVDA